MKKLYTLVILTLLSHLSFSQDIVATRTATLQNSSRYKTSGTATLTEFSDGSTTFSFNDDFLTQSGPDVQVWLVSTSEDVSGGLFIADIGDESSDFHTSGSKTFDVPSGTSIDDYDHITLKCVRFGNLLWGSGELGEKETVTGLFSNHREESTLEVFPNPTSGPISVKVPTEMKNGSLKIISNQGTTVYSAFISNSSSQKILLTNLKNGYYVLVLENENKKISSTFAYQN